MDDIKTNIEKIFDQFSDSIASAIPKRLSFDNGEDSTFRTRKFFLDLFISIKIKQKFKFQNQLKEKQNHLKLQTSPFAIKK